MIPRWQWIAIVLLVAGIFALAILGSPGSYAYLFVTGQCFHKSELAACRNNTAPGRARFW